MVLEVTQEEEDENRESNAAILPVKGIPMDTPQYFSAGPVCFS